MSDSAVPDEVLASQIVYYKARAAEYDEWFCRKGRYDHGAMRRACAMAIEQRHWRQTLIDRFIAP